MKGWQRIDLNILKEEIKESKKKKAKYTIIIIIISIGFVTWELRIKNLELFPIWEQGNLHPACLKQ